MTKKNVRFGLGLITAKGLVFNEKTYTNAQMIKYQWFEHASKFGEWECPIGYIESNPEYIVLFNTEEIEVATSIEVNIPIQNEAVLQAYFEGINNLKTRLQSKRDHQN